MNTNRQILILTWPALLVFVTVFCVIQLPAETDSSRMDFEDYKKVLKMFRSGQPYIHDPFEERDVKCVFGKIEYDGSEKIYTFELIEDIR